VTTNSLLSSTNMGVLLFLILPCMGEIITATHPSCLIYLYYAVVVFKINNKCSMCDQMGYCGIPYIMNLEKDYNSCMHKLEIFTNHYYMHARSHWAKLRKFLSNLATFLSASKKIFSIHCVIVLPCKILLNFASFFKLSSIISES